MALVVADVGDSRSRVPTSGARWTLLSHGGLRDGGGVGGIDGRLGMYSAAAACGGPGHDVNARVASRGARRLLRGREGLRMRDRRRRSARQRSGTDVRRSKARAFGRGRLQSCFSARCRTGGSGEATTEP